MRCKKCLNNKLIYHTSKETGICYNCRWDSVPDHIPLIQRRRYLKFRDPKIKYEIQKIQNRKNS